MGDAEMERLSDRGSIPLRSMFIKDIALGIKSQGLFYI